MSQRGGLLSVLVIVTGCGSMSIEGEIVDVAGKPVEGATVTVAGTLCQAHTDALGKYAVGCQPGKHQVSIGATGYIGDDFEVEATELKAYEAPRIVLVKMPMEKGLFMFRKGEYQPMTRGVLHKDRGSQGGDETRAYCVSPDLSEAVEVKAGPTPFFDYEHPGWRPFKLDESGCAYRDRRVDLRWQVDYKEKPEYTTNQVEQGKEIAVIEFQPGEYFIADWKGGFFSASDDDKNLYTGYWIKAQ